MLDKKYQSIVFTFFMSLLMSCIMSFVISVFNIGFASDLSAIWFKAWCFAFVVAFPAITVISPVVRKLVSLTIRNQPGQ